MSHAFRGTSSQEKQRFAEISHVFPDRHTVAQFGPCGVPKTGQGGRTWRQVATVRDVSRQSRKVRKVAAGMPSDQPPLDPNRLTPDQAAKLLSAAAKVRIPVEQIAADLDDGAPQNRGRHDQPRALRRLAGEGDGPWRLTPANYDRANSAGLLNSTPLGEVINERQLHRHRTRAGMRIGDGRHVDLLRYVAWLVEVRHAPQAGTRRRSVREAQGARPCTQRRAGDRRSRHRRVARGRQSRPQSEGGIRLPVLLRFVLPADVSPAVVARSSEGHRARSNRRFCAAGCLRWRCLADRARPRSVNAPASGRCSTVIASSSA